MKKANNKATSKRRSNGQGSIIKRNDGRWQGQVTIGRQPNGRLKRKTVYGKTKKEVQEKITVLLYKLQANELTDPSKMLLKDWLEHWLAAYVKPFKSEATYDSYLSNIELHIIPELGRIPLKNLKTTDLQLHYETKLIGGRADGQEGGLSCRSVNYLKTILGSALGRAVKSGLIPYNVNSEIQSFKGRRKIPRALTIFEQTQLVEIFKKDIDSVPYWFMLRTGVRKGECIALKWSQIDLDNKIIFIISSVRRVKNHNDGKAKTKLLDGNTKTASSIRQIPISDKLVSLLKEYKAYMAEILEANGIKESEYVFPSLVGTAKEPSNFDRKFKSYIEEAGLQKINLHSLRHTFATRALENGVNPRIVQEQLGHKSIKTTLGIYSHVLLPVHRDAINQIDDVFDK